MFTLIGILFTGIFALISGIIALILYILFAMAAVKTLRIAGFANPWYGWVPFLNIYSLAIAATKNISSVRMHAINLDITVYRLFWVLIIAVSFIPTAGKTIALVLSIIYYSDLFSRIYAAYDDTSIEDEFRIGILSAFFNPVFSIKVLTSDESHFHIHTRPEDVLSDYSQS